MLLPTSGKFLSMKQNVFFSKNVFFRIQYCISFQAGLILKIFHHISHTLVALSVKDILILYISFSLQSNGNT